MNEAELLTTPLKEKLLAANKDYQHIKERARAFSAKKIMVTAEAHNSLPFEIEKKGEIPGAVTSDSSIFYELDINAEPTYYFDKTNFNHEYIYINEGLYTYRYIYDIAATPDILQVAAIPKKSTDWPEIQYIHIAGGSGFTTITYQSKNHRVINSTEETSLIYGIKTSISSEFFYYESGILKEIKSSNQRKSVYVFHIKDSTDKLLQLLNIEYKRKINSAINTQLKVYNELVCALVYSYDQPLPIYAAIRPKDCDLETATPEEVFDILWNPADFPDYATPALNINSEQTISFGEKINSLPNSRIIVKQFLHQLCKELNAEHSGKCLFFAIDDEAVDII